MFAPLSLNPLTHSVQFRQFRIRIIGLVDALLSVLRARGHVLGRLAAARLRVESIADAAIVHTRPSIVAHKVASAVRRRRVETLLGERKEAGQTRFGTLETEERVRIAVGHLIGPVATVRVLVVGQTLGALEGVRTTAGAALVVAAIRAVTGREVAELVLALLGRLHGLWVQIKALITQVYL